MEKWHEGLEHLKKLSFTPEQLEKIPVEIIPRLIGMLVSLVLNRGLEKKKKNGQKGNG